MTEQSKAASDVLAERQRQIDEEGWTHGDDDQYEFSEMAFAAAVYALDSAWESNWQDSQRLLAAIRELWPWEENWHKSTTPRRDLVKAGALIIAEIERLDRAEYRENANG